jgi:hypothetical protein
MPCSRPACPHELPRTRGLGKQETLQHIETQLPRSEEISPAFDTLSDSACSIAIGKVEDLTAHRLFHRIVGAALYENLIDLDLNKREVLEAGERGPFRSNVIERNGNLAGTKSLCDVLCECEIAHNVGAIDFDDPKAAWSGRL